MLLALLGELGQGGWCPVIEDRGFNELGVELVADEQRLGVFEDRSGRGKRLRLELGLRRLIRPEGRRCCVFLRFVERAEFRTCFQKRFFLLRVDARQLCGDLLVQRIEHLGITVADLLALRVEFGFGRLSSGKGRQADHQAPAPNHHECSHRSL